MIEIRIMAHLDRGDLDVQIDQAMHALGFERIVVRGEMTAGEIALHGAGVSTLGMTATEAAAGAEASAVTNAGEREPVKAIRKRRTKAEIALDNAVNAKLPTPSMAVEAAQSQDSAETQAQDAADEVAESAASKPSVLTYDDIRQACGEYVKKFGIAAAQEDVPKLWELAFPGQGFKKVTDIPDDQEALTRSLAGLNELIEKNPYERTAVSA